MALTISELAREAAGHFTSKTVHRHGAAEPETITTTGDDTPEWIGDMVREAHGDMLPDDWRYEAIRSALDAIADSGADDRYELDDLAHEWADGEVDVYTGRRLAWLASNLTRLGYVDQAVDELGGSELDTAERIGLGQYQEASEVWASVVQSLADELDEREDADAEEVAS